MFTHVKSEWHIYIQGSPPKIWKKRFHDFLPDLDTFPYHFQQLICEKFYLEHEMIIITFLDENKNILISR